MPAVTIMTVAYDQLIPTMAEGWCITGRQQDNHFLKRQFIFHSNLKTMGPHILSAKYLNFKTSLFNLFTCLVLFAAH